MKTLYLVRHATALKRKSQKSDIKRPLSQKGKKEASKIAGKMKNGNVPDLLISSPAKRAMQTARLFAKKMNYPVEKIVVNDALYENTGAESETAFLNLVHALDNRHRSAMLFGHDPLITDAVHFLGKDSPKALPACAVVAYQFRNRNWNQIAKGTGTLQFFDHPKRAREVKRETSAALEAKIQTELEKVLSSVDEAVPGKMQKSIRKNARDLTRLFFRTRKTVGKKGKNA